MKMGTRVFVGGLTHRVRERDIEKFFRKYGRIKEVAMKNGFAFVEFDDHRDADDAIYELNGRDLLGEKVSVERARGTPRGSDQWRGNMGGSRGYGGPPRNRDTRDNTGGSNSMGSRQGSASPGRPGKPGKVRYGPPQRTRYRVYVDNLSSRVSWQDLKDYMRQAGVVTYADAHKQRRNEGIVEFASYKDMKSVIEKLDGTELNGRKIKLIEDRQTKRSSRSRSSSRSKSRSRSVSRSRSRSRSKRSSKSRSQSPAGSKTRSKDGSKSRSRSPREKNNVRAISHTRSRSESRSQSPNTTREDM